MMAGGCVVAACPGRGSTSGRSRIAVPVEPLIRRLDVVALRTRTRIISEGRLALLLSSPELGGRHARLPCMDALRRKRARRE